jgi:hypothetical protein
VYSLWERVQWGERAVKWGGEKTVVLLSRRKRLTEFVGERTVGIFTVWGYSEEKELSSEEERGHYYERKRWLSEEERGHSGLRSVLTVREGTVRIERVERVERKLWLFKRGKRWLNEEERGQWWYSLCEGTVRRKNWRARSREDSSTSQQEKEVTEWEKRREDTQTLRIEECTHCERGYSEDWEDWEGWQWGDRENALTIPEEKEVTEWGGKRTVRVGKCTVWIERVQCGLRGYSVKCTVRRGRCGVGREGSWFSKFSKDNE